jgi:haloalkane dehalogenase
MRYVDEGRGKPLVMVHGNPYWSFEYRRLISHFSGKRRCVAPDLLGFGLSDKPGEWGYLPQQHAESLEELLDSLDLREITMVVNDWGGPVGLAYAIEHPERIESVVVTNSWLWSVADDWYYRAFSGFVGGAIGRFLIRRFNFFARGVVRRVFGDKKKLTAELHKQITAPLATPDERKGSWVFPGQIVGASDWLEELWERRGRLEGKVKLIVWGMKDIAFREKELERWRQAFPGARVLRLPQAGHFVAEEAPEPLIEAIEGLSQP